MPALNPEHVKTVITAINNSPFFRHMSMSVEEMGIGRAVVVVDIKRNHMNPFGGLHGGVYASSIDTAAYWSAYCDIPEGCGLVTIDLKVDLLSPVRDGKIIVVGKRIKAGRSICLTEAEMRDDAGKLLAHGTSKLMTTDQKQSIDDVIEYIGSEKLPSKFITE